METYEQKYKEALERARLLKLANPDDVAIQTFVKDSFPELKESEDERMIEQIKFAVMQMPSNREDTKKECLAWLEKQKYDRMKPIYDARESFESALEKAWNDYHNGYENVDKLEDDYVECAHAKGFREGYLFGIEKRKEYDLLLVDKVIEWFNNIQEQKTNNYGNIRTENKNTI